MYETALWSRLSSSLDECLIALMMEASRTSETSVYFYYTTRFYIPEGHHIHTGCRQNLKSLKINCIFLKKLVPLRHMLDYEEIPPSDKC
jgi:hypothetical protein